MEWNWWQTDVQSHRTCGSITQKPTWSYLQSGGSYNNKYRDGGEGKMRVRHSREMKEGSWMNRETRLTAAFHLISFISFFKNLYLSYLFFFFWPDFKLIWQKVSFIFFTITSNIFYLWSLRKNVSVILFVFQKNQE